MRLRLGDRRRPRAGYSVVRAQKISDASSIHSSHQPAPSRRTRVVSHRPEPVPFERILVSGSCPCLMGRSAGMGGLSCLPRGWWPTLGELRRHLDFRGHAGLRHDRGVALHARLSGPWRARACHRPNCSTDSGLVWPPGLLGNDAPGTPWDLTLAVNRQRRFMLVVPAILGAARWLSWS